MRTPHKFRAIGLQCSAREPSTSFHLFCDFTLPRLAPALAAHPAKRRTILRTFYAFVATGVFARVQVWAFSCLRQRVCAIGSMVNVRAAAALGGWCVFRRDKRSNNGRVY